MIIALLAFAASAGAARHANDAEFGEIAAAIPAEDLDGGYFCPNPEGTWISALDSSWALVEMRGNCGLGSQAARVFLMRDPQTAQWQLAQRHYENLGSGEGAACASMAVPLDIRCGPTALKGKVLLGSRFFTGPSGKGFGKPRPRTIYNGGVPSGLILKIRWKRWGRRVAVGRGRGHQYKPRGGYYRQRVAVRLRAQRLGRCADSQLRAYTQLLVSTQKRPGGRFEKWRLWSGKPSICAYGFSG